MHPQTVLYVITKATWGGAQRYVYDLATEAKARGYGVSVAYGEEGLLTRRLEEAQIRTVRIEGLRRDVSGFGEIGALRSLVRLLKQEQPDVVHLNSSKAGFTGALAAHFARVPNIFFTAHGWAFNEARPFWQRLVFRMLSFFIVMLSDKTICVSGAVRRDMSGFFTRKKLHVVRNGITCPVLIEQKKARETLLPRTSAPRWIGMVAELHTTKRVDLAIEAFSHVAATHPETILVVLGEGQERATLEKQIATQGLTERVHLLGFIENGSSYLPAFDLLLLPSRTEALAYVLLEAGCAALPVIASSVGGLPEIVGADAGILVQSGDAAALATAITELLENTEKAKMLGENLQKRVATLFTRERMLSETFALY